MNKTASDIAYGTKILWNKVLFHPIEHWVAIVIYLNQIHKMSFDYLYNCIIFSVVIVTVVLNKFGFFSLDIQKVQSPTISSQISPQTDNAVSFKIHQYAT